MPLHVRDGGAWREITPANGDVWTKQGGVWVPVMEVSARDGGSWRQIHLRSDPITWTTYFGASGWSQVYRGTSGVTSNRTNGDDLAYWGFSWNNEIERSMVSVYDVIGNQMAADERPIATAGTVKLWVGHVYSGTMTAYVGIDDATSKPSSFQRLHGEKDSGWGHQVGLTKPGTGAGALDTSTLASTTRQNWWNQMIFNNFNALTITAEDATDPNNIWGWCSGRQHSTGNSGGSASGLNNLSWSDAETNRIDWTIDYS